MAQDNTKSEWQAYCVMKDGERIEWNGLRHRQAKWRYDCLSRDMTYLGKRIREFGYRKESGAIA